MRRKAASKIQSRPTQEITIKKAANVSDGESDKDDSANGTVIEVADEKSASGKKAENTKIKVIVEEKVVPALKRGRKKVGDNLEGKKMNGSDNILQDDEEEKLTEAEAVKDGQHEQDASENGAENKTDGKSAVASKRGRKKVVENYASDKVPASKFGKKPADVQNASVSKVIEDDVSNDKVKDNIPKENSKVSENQSVDSSVSVPAPKNIPKAPGKRGRKKAEAKADTEDETENPDTLPNMDRETNEDKSSNLSEDDFQPSSHSVGNKKGAGKRVKKTPGVSHKLEDIKEKNDKIDGSIADEISSSKAKAESEEPAKRGRKRKNKNEDDVSSKEHGIILDDNAMKKMKEVKVMLNRKDVLIDNENAEGSNNNLEGKVKTVPNQKGKTAKRGRGKGEAELESTDEKPAKVPKKADKPKREKIPDVTALDFSSERKTSSGKPWNFKISSWNINGIRAWLEKDGISYLHHEKPDILCVQETKCSDDKLPDEMKVVDGYHTYWLSGDKDGYSGVGLFTKEKPLKLEYGIGSPEHDNEGRVITAEYKQFYLVAAYIPNAGRGLVRLSYRTKWDKDFRAYLKKLDDKKPVILCGDLNVAHEEIDLANPKTNKKNAGFTKEEREGFSTLLKENDFIDTFRHLYPDIKGAYTFWTYMMNARAKNTGWRLDYFVISKRFEDSLCDSVIRKDVFGSDHCPITLFLSI